MTAADRRSPDADLALSVERDQELTRLVYTLALEPHRLQAMLALVNDELERLYQTGETANAPPLFDHLATHLETAMELLERQVSRTAGVSRARHLVNLDPKPAILLDRDMTVIHTNEGGRTVLSAEPGVRLSCGLFSSEASERLARALRKIDKRRSRGILTVVELTPAPGEPADSGTKFVLSLTVDDDGQPMGHLTSLKVRWHDHTGESFRAAFDLTSAETAIVQGIVEGFTPSEIARHRGRSEGTVRNQLKTIFAKLGLHSQTELVCLYAGFDQVNALPDFFDYDPNRTTGNGAEVYPRASGGQMDVEFYGPLSGRPVLFFPTVIGGAGLTRDMQRLVDRQGLRLIMPWLPGFKNTTDNGDWSPVLETFADDVAGFLKDQGIGKVVALTQSNFLIPALVLENRHPGLVSAIVAASASVPLVFSGQFSQMSVQQRMPYYLARHAPVMLDFYLRALMAKLDSGHDETYIAEFFETTSWDSATILQCPEMKQLAREGVAHVFRQGHKGLVNFVRTEATNWLSLLECSQCPITMFTSDGNTEFPPAMVHQVTNRLANVETRDLPGTGTLAWFQKPEIILDEVSSAWERVARS